MAKKNKKKKLNKTKEFCGLLQEYQKNISVLKNEEHAPLTELTKESIENTTAVPFDGVIPVSATDAVKEKSSAFETNVYYSNSVFKLFEMTLSIPVRHTLILTIDAEDAPYIFDTNYNEAITTLLSRTNLSLVINNLGKPVKKLKRWVEMESETDMDMFVLNIPELVLFTNKIRKDKESEAVFFNLMIQIVKTKKSVEKLRKKHKIEDLSKFIIKCTLENIKNFGCSSVVYELKDTFSEDWQELAENWRIALQSDESISKITNKLSFTITDSVGMTTVSNEFWTRLISSDSKK